MGEAGEESPAASGDTPAQVFVSYSRGDQAKARQLIAVLQQSGFSVWWDGLLEAGAVFIHDTEHALETAQAVVVLWSARSVKSTWVRDEATTAKEHSALVPVSLDGTLPPLGFRQFQSIDLSAWKGDPAAPEIANIVGAVGKLVGDDGARAPARPVARSRWQPLPRRAVVAGLIALAAVGAAGTVAALRERGGGGREATLAILPFANLSQDRSQDYFSDGLSEELRGALSNSGGLRVTAETSSRKFRGELGDPKSIADALGVKWLLDGSVRREGDTVRVSAQLIDGKSGFDNWSATYQRNMADIFAVQSDIAHRVASALSVRIGEAGKSRQLRPGGTTNPAAFDAYLRGVALYELALDEASDRSAEAQFRAAIAADPNYGAAWAALSRSQTTIANTYANDRPLATLYAEAIASAQKAIALAPQLAQAHAALGYVLFNGKLDARGAEGPYRKSYEVGPGNADILQGYATYMARTGRFDESRAAIEKALVLDPLNPSTWRTKGLILFAQGRFGDARTALKRALELNPEMSSIHKTFGQMAYLEGKYRLARDEFLKEGSGLNRLQGLAMTLPRLGDAAGGAKALADLRQRYGNNSLYQQAEVLAQTGRKDDALAVLQTAYARGDSGLVQALNDPLLASLKGDPRFHGVLRAIGFPGT